MTMLVLLQLVFTAISGVMWRETGEATWAYAFGTTSAFAFSMCLDTLLKRLGYTRRL